MVGKTNQTQYLAVRLARAGDLQIRWKVSFLSFNLNALMLSKQIQAREGNRLRNFFPDR